MKPCKSHGEIYGLLLFLGILSIFYSKMTAGTLYYCLTYISRLLYLLSFLFTFASKHLVVTSHDSRILAYCSFSRYFETFRRVCRSSRAPYSSAPVPNWVVSARSLIYCPVFLVAALNWVKDAYPQRKIAQTPLFAVSNVRMARLITLNLIIQHAKFVSLLSFAKMWHLSSNYWCIFPLCFTISALKLAWGPNYTSISTIRAVINRLYMLSIFLCYQMLSKLMFHL